MVTRRRRPNGTEPDPVRSVRVGNESWSAAQMRAAYEGRTMSEVVSLLVAGYARGQLQLPEMELVYRVTSEGDAAQAGGVTH